MGVFSYENSSIRNAVIPKNSIDKSVLVGSGKTLYFVEVVSPDVMNIDNSSVLLNRMNDFIKNLKEASTPYEDIVNKQGKVAFRVYKIKF